MKEIKLIKPGASEFKRREHYLKIIMKIFSFVEDEEIKNTKFKDLNIKKDSSGSILYKKYLEYEILKKPSNSINWNDRFTSLFIRQGFLKKENGYLKPTKMLISIIKINNNIHLSPFSKYDFALILISLTSLSNENKETLLFRTVNILKNKKLKKFDFYFNFMINDYEENIKEIENFIFEKNKKELDNLLNYLSGYTEKNKNLMIERDDMLLSFQEIILSEKNFFILLNEKFKKFNKNISEVEKNIFKKILKSICILIGNEEKFILNEKNMDNLVIEFKHLDNIKFRAKLLFNFSFLKKYYDYSYLINMYTRDLPMLEISKNEISIKHKWLELSEHLSKITLDKNSFSKSIEDLYEEIIPIKFRVEYFEKEGFYSNLKIDTLKKILIDKKLWVNKDLNSILKWNSFLPDINKTNLPDYYEFLVILFLYKISEMPKEYKKFSESINTKLNSEYMPIHHAPGGVPDAVFLINNIITTIEPTIQTGNAQAKHEHSVYEHAINSNAEHCYIVSPQINESINKYAFQINSSNSKKHKNIKLIPIETSNKFEYLNKENLNNYINKTLILIEEEEY